MIGGLRFVLREYPNTKFFLVRIFLYSVRMWENTDQKKPRIRTIYSQCWEILQGKKKFKRTNVGRSFTAIRIACIILEEKLAFLAYISI